MRRATGIVLVLLGGGLAVGLSTCGPSRECQQARAAGRPDAEQLCRSSGSSGRSSASSSHGGSYGGSGDSAAASSARGGFGSTAGHASGGG
jgi:hypothetical protein